MATKRPPAKKSTKNVPSDYKLRSLKDDVKLVKELGRKTVLAIREGYATGANALLTLTASMEDAQKNRSALKAKFTRKGERDELFYTYSEIVSSAREGIDMIREALTDFIG